MLKADLHIHTKEDPLHKGEISYSAKELIDHAAKLGYEILSITNHDKVTFSKKLASHAKKKGILLMPGIERTIKGKHVLIYNITQKQADKIKEFSDLKRLKNKLVIAAHPYFVLPCSLGKRLKENIELFDAIEYSSFCTAIINFNKKAMKVAKKHGKPIIGNSDAHYLTQFGNTYSLINAKKDKRSVIEAIKKGKIKLQTSPVSHYHFLKTAIKVLNPTRNL